MKELEGKLIFKVKQFIKADELYDFIKKEITFEEVMKLYRLLQEDIEGQIEITSLYSPDGEIIEKAIKNGGDFHKKYYE